MGGARRDCGEPRIYSRVLVGSANGVTGPRQQSALRCTAAPSVGSGRGCLGRSWGGVGAGAGAGPGRRVLDAAP